MSASDAQAESIVYGIIHDVAPEQSLVPGRWQHNQQVLHELPEDLVWDLLAQPMFSLPPLSASGLFTHHQVIHFGASYNAVEYEWQLWMKKFEGLLNKMYWVEATVHLETEVMCKHLFQWRTEVDYHQPNSGKMAVSCEWEHEGRLQYG